MLVVIWLSQGPSQLEPLVFFIFFPHFILFYLFWPCPWHVEVPGPGIEPTPREWQWQILNPQSHTGTPIFPFHRCGKSVPSRLSSLVKITQVRDKNSESRVGHWGIWIFKDQEEEDPLEKERVGGNQRSIKSQKPCVESDNESCLTEAAASGYLKNRVGKVYGC